MVEDNYDNIKFPIFRDCFSSSHSFLYPQVQEADGHVSTWVQWVDERRSEYVWLLFFSVPKVLVLNSFLCAEQPLADLDNIIHELSFLCTNTSEARDAMYEGVKVFSPSGACTCKAYVRSSY